MITRRALTLLEVLVVAAIIGLAASLAVVPAYLDYSRARAASDAATTLAQDLSLIERAAQNAGPNVGGTLEIISADPLVYECRYGRPNEIDPNSMLGDLIVRRSFDHVALAQGVISSTTPLLFASNGSAQFVQAGEWSDQHQTIELTLVASGDSSRAARVDVNLFTGAIAQP
ncbi:MAG TPA: type II secretion system protein [Candidatus Tumulicola sp.]|nr:type II secretion system protein [Candidatus Tumulicola sp.]